MSAQTIHFLKPHPPKKSTHQNILSAKNPHENNKNQAKKLKVYGTNVDFLRPHPPPPRVYGLYTHENVDIYGWPLRRYQEICRNIYYILLRCDAQNDLIYCVKLKYQLDSC